jgi:phosphate-selective porin OprO and OprP
MYCGLDGWRETVLGGLTSMRYTAGRRIGLFGGAAAACLLLASGSIAAPSAPSAADSARDARIAKLEAALADVESRLGHEDVLEKENTELKGQVADLTAQVADLKVSTISQIQDVRQTQAAAPKMSLPGGRPTFATADGNFTASLRGVLQFDAAGYFQASPGVATGAGASDFRRDGPAIGTSGVDLAHARQLKDGTLFRRARIGIDGTVSKTVDYRLLFDFGGAGVENSGQLYEAWVQYSGLQPLHLRVGAFSPSDGLEDQGSTNGMLFLERPGASDVARNLAAGDTRTAAAVIGYGDHWFASGAVTGRTIGVLNTGTATPTPQTFGDQVGFVARAAFTPLHGADWLVHLGAHGSYVARPANVSGVAANGVTPVSSYVVRLRDTPELRVDGTQFIDTGSVPAHNANEAGLEFAAQKRNLFLQGEYERFGVDRSDRIANPTFNAWYVEASWLLTGESRKYNSSTAAFDAPPVAHPFSPADGSWGAFELAARYSDTNLNFHAGAPGTAPSIDAVRGGEQRVWTVGLNWYLNPVVRLMFDFDHVEIERLSPNGTVFSTLTGAPIGQSFNAVAVRTQAAF